MKTEISSLKTLSAKEIELLNRLEFEGRGIYTSENITFFCDRMLNDLMLLEAMG